MGVGRKLVCLAEELDRERWELCSQECRVRCRSNSVHVRLDLRSSLDYWHRSGSSIVRGLRSCSSQGRRSLALRLNTSGVGQVWAERVSESPVGASTGHRWTSPGCTLAEQVPGSLAGTGCSAHSRRSLPWSKLPRWKRLRSRCRGTMVPLVFCPRSDSKQQARHMSVKVSKIVKSNKS